MPVQYTVCGHPVSPTLPPRRITYALCGSLSIITTFLFVVLSSTPSVPSVSTLTGDFPHHLSEQITGHIPAPNIPSISLPNFPNPFAPAAHKPPVQVNSSNGQVSWYSHWKWLNPFSSTITLDENRSVLPPLRTRPPIYTFYEADSAKDEAAHRAEDRLLLTWRRAWWAQGFRPVVLGRAEAMNNPMYESLRALQMEPTMEAELARWLAWEHMGSGILASWLAVPNAPREDLLLAHLRRGDFVGLTRYDGLGSGLFCGEQAAITAAVKQALANPKFKESRSFIDAVPKQTFQMDAHSGSVAYYESSIVDKKYSVVSTALKEAPAKGLEMLAELINGHLHLTFHDIYSGGLSVLMPLPEVSLTLVEAALDLATALAQCPRSPMPLSCPPNRPKCGGCDPGHLPLIATPTSFRNVSTIYSIGTVPHPYTMASLLSKREELDRRFIRRETDRDAWTMAVTQELLGADVGSGPRVSRFKELVAGDFNSVHSLWLTPEKGAPTELEWHFGFQLPKAEKAKRPSPVTLSSDDLRLQKTLLDKARVAVKSNGRQQKSVREMIEAWNLADTEAWRFARAYRARNNVEREKWEADEKKYAGGRDDEKENEDEDEDENKRSEGREGRGSGWGHWFGG